MWVVLSLFQEATCSDLVFSRALSFFERSTWNCLCFRGYWINSPPVAAIHSSNVLFLLQKRSCNHIFFQIYCIFLGQEDLKQGDTIVINYNTFLVSGMYKLKYSLLLDDFNFSHPFNLWYWHYFTGTLEAIHYVQDTVFNSKRLLQPSIIYSIESVVNSRKFEGCRVYLRKAIASLLY